MGLICVQQFRHPHNASNTYLISQENNLEVYLIDAGFSDIIIEFLGCNKRIAGVFLTHAHYDHICDLNKLITHFPELVVYCSEYTCKGLFSDRLNLSFYHESPFIFLGNSIKIIKGEKDEVVFNNIKVKCIHTPGHDPGCITYKINDYLFTGDSFIPGYDVVTKLKGGNKIDSQKSLLKIRNMITPSTIVCPGHFEMKNILNLDSFF
jgi:hydroxyacylglutathione hydrolase